METRGHRVNARERRPELGQVEPAVHGRDHERPQTSAGNPGQVVDVRVDEVELRRSGDQLFDLQDSVCERVADTHLPERSRRRGVQHGRGSGSSGGKERDVMAAFDQGLGQGLDDTLGASVAFGWNAHKQRRDLGDFHRTTSATFSCQECRAWPRAPRLQVISPAANGFKRPGLDPGLEPGLDPGWSVVCHLQAIRLVHQKQEV